MYAVLHRVSADLGEQIAVHSAVDGEIEVEGVIDSDARRMQIRDAIAGIPYAKAEIESISEATAHRDVNLPRSTLATLVESNPPLLAERIKHSFPDANQRSKFVNASMFLCQDDSAHAWALNKLADRYTPQNLALLSADENFKLHGILADHIAALRGDVGHLQRQLGPLPDYDLETSTASAVTGDLLSASGASL
ncbi:hypothetical protein [Bryocella elongata]|uniref:hypothetical protein n=1 Tax=Bryocella elongata TaxID=863522 RepID=UPI0011AFDC21|nr:hypothetical protein [Bryocella elongata]